MVAYTDKMCLSFFVLKLRWFYYVAGLLIN